ncbi:class I SAM-dependent methyltransferase [Pseudodonghicola flavimaris]|uniref:Methyltransferase domain-containing protein n=1 Tax=Pseudodonghicola flavimaris TaxID=3050036 RepID=A0ABT7F1I2_9RHOB|nr:methyltransferase domain-containing protein [Pseudodonghicola flavimaris]MDK3018435.1 methyltransferase domain-containing protein [Pseudodonghicola flavimaris]
MHTDVEIHYSIKSNLADKIATGLERAGKRLDTLVSSDLASVDEFHIRGRKATLELGQKLNLAAGSRLLDLGSGLGGPARTMAETYGCSVTGIDLTEEFCHAANVMTSWLGLQDKVVCQQGDATDLPFADDSFDAAMTIHVAMNIAAKDRLYAEAHRTLKPGGRFAVYDVIQGDGGEVHFPVPWAREPSISHLATDAEMRTLLPAAGFRVIEVTDSSAESLRWFEDMAARLARSGPPPVSFHAILGDDFSEMARNQVRNLAEDRIRTISYICEG